MPFWKEMKPVKSQERLLEKEHRKYNVNDNLAIDLLEKIMVLNPLKRYSV